MVRTVIIAMASVMIIATGVVRVANADCAIAVATTAAIIAIANT